MMHFDIITIFPKIFDSYFNESIIKHARLKKFIDIRIRNLRDFVKDKHRSVDDSPYGGGAGMVLKPLPILKAVDHIFKRKRKNENCKIIVLSAKGKPFTQKMAFRWSRKISSFILISGRYEGIDERVRLALRAEEISIGPYVLTDGDVAAMVVISTLTRLIPGVIKFESLQEESYFDLLKRSEVDAATQERLEYPHYTRPAAFKYKGRMYRVPPVLLSGNHRNIREWRMTKRRG